MANAIILTIIITIVNYLCVNHVVLRDIRRLVDCIPSWYHDKLVQ